MHEPAACGARPAQHASVQMLPAETDAIGTIEEKNPAASSNAIAIPLPRRTLECPSNRGFISERGHSTTITAMGNPRAQNSATVECS
jgi:hypothetical protein